MEKGPTPVFLGFPGVSDGKKSSCTVGDGFDPWVGKIPWRRAWQPTPVFLPGESPWTEEPGWLQFTGSQRIRHSLAIEHTQMLPLGPKTHRHDSTIGLLQIRLPKPHYLIDRECSFIGRTN